MEEVFTKDRFVEKSKVLYIEGIKSYFNSGLPVRPLALINERFLEIGEKNYILINNVEFSDKFNQEKSKVFWFGDMLMFYFQESELNYHTEMLPKKLIDEINNTGKFNILVQMDDGYKGISCSDKDLKSAFKEKKLMGENLLHVYNFLYMFHNDKIWLPYGTRVMLTEFL